MTTYLKEDFLFDADLVLEDSLDSDGVAAAIDGVDSYAGSVLAVDTVIDVGDGLVEGYMIVDVDAIVVADDEDYTIKLQGTQTAAFDGADFVDLAMLKLGHADALVGDASAGAAGDRFVIPFRNEQNGEVYRYVRAFTLMDADGVGESITATMWLSIKR